MSDPITACVPVYASRHNPTIKDRPGYGADISWAIGEEALVQERSGPPVRAKILSETRHHPGAPEINGARGWGRWVREVIVEGEDSPCAVSEARLLLP